MIYDINKRSLFTKDVTTGKNWTSEAGLESRVNVPIFVLVGFLQKDQFNQQHQIIDTFYTPSVVSAQRFIGIEKYQDGGIGCIHTFDK